MKIESRPAGEFIIIPETGILAPKETKDFKVYLSKRSVGPFWLSQMHKEELNNCQIQIFGTLDYRYNESIAVPSLLTQRQYNLGAWPIIQQQS